MFALGLEAFSFYEFDVMRNIMAACVLDLFGCNNPLSLLEIASLWLASLLPHYELFS